MTETNLPTLTLEQISDLIETLRGPAQADVTANGLHSASGSDISPHNITEALWYFDYSAGRCLKWGIAEAFIEGIARFPDENTPELRCVCLYFLSKIVPHEDFVGSDQEDHIRYAYLVAKVLDITTSDLQAAWVKGNDLDKVLENCSTLVTDESSKEYSKLRKKAWFYAGDVYVRAVAFVASSPDVKVLVESYDGSHTLSTFARASREAYSEGRSAKFSRLTIPSQEQYAAEDWLRISRGLQSAAWSSLEDDFSVGESRALAALWNNNWNVGYDRSSVAQKLELHMARLRADGELRGEDIAQTPLRGFDGVDAP
ncbi:hypothetical protein ACLOAV_004551 [Pseudogymnoascus australis]